MLGHQADPIILGEALGEARDQAVRATVVPISALPAASTSRA